MGLESRAHSARAISPQRNVLDRTGIFHQEACSVPSARYHPCSMSQTYRVIIAKPGLDGHDRGAKVVARALRDAGFEVIYTGLHQTPEQIVETAIQEDADVIGLSSHSGAHMTLFPKVTAQLADQGVDDIVVFGGGIIPAEDVSELQEAGVERVYGPGASTQDIVAWLHERLGA